MNIAYVTPSTVPGVHPTMFVSNERRNKTTLFGLGITEVVFGALFAMTNVIIIILVVPEKYFFSSVEFILISPGIWCGVIAIACGILGICSRPYPSRCVFIANMVMSIITALAMITLLGLSTKMAILSEFVIVVILQLVCAVGSFVLLIVAVIHYAYCCAAVCCDKMTEHGSVVQQLVQMPNGQYLPAQVYPHTSQRYSNPEANTAPTTESQDNGPGVQQLVQMPNGKYLPAQACRYTGHGYLNPEANTAPTTAQSRDNGFLQ